MATKAPGKSVDKVKQFSELASKRTEKVLKDLDILENCTLKASYTYTAEQAVAVIKAIRTAVDRVEASFKRGGKAPAGGGFSV